MPDFVLEALKNEKVYEIYKERPAYQQNDYLSWITRAQREETRLKRLNQMLKELHSNTLYMNMKYNLTKRPSKK